MRAAKRASIGIRIVCHTSKLSRDYIERDTNSFLVNPDRTGMVGKICRHENEIAWLRLDDALLPAIRLQLFQVVGRTNSKPTGVPPWPVRDAWTNDIINRAHPRLAVNMRKEMAFSG